MAASACRLLCSLVIDIKKNRSPPLVIKLLRNFNFINVSPYKQGYSYTEVGNCFDAYFRAGYRIAFCYKLNLGMYSCIFVLFNMLSTLAYKHFLHCIDCYGNEPIAGNVLCTDAANDRLHYNATSFIIEWAQFMNNENCIMPKRKWIQASLWSVSRIFFFIVSGCVFSWWCYFLVENFNKETVDYIICNCGVRFHMRILSITPSTVIMWFFFYFFFQSVSANTYSNQPKKQLPDATFLYKSTHVFIIKS